MINFGPRNNPGQESSSSSSDEEDVTRRTVSAGGLSLHELNNRLEKYIRQINLNPDTPNVSIAVDRVRYPIKKGNVSNICMYLIYQYQCHIYSEGGNFDISNMPQFLEYERLVSSMDYKILLSVRDFESNIFKCI